MHSQSGGGARPRAGAGLLLAVLAAGCVTSGESPEHRWRDVQLQTATFDPLGRPVAGGGGLGGLVWGLGPGLAGAAPPAGWPGSGEPLPQDPRDPQDLERLRQEQEARLRAQFGSSVIILEDGRITQQYPFVGESAAVFLKLISSLEKPIATDPKEGMLPAFQNEPVGGEEGKGSILGQMMGSRGVEVSFVPQFSKIAGVKIRDDVLGKKVAVLGEEPKALGDNFTHLALVTGLPSHVLAFERALDLFYANMPQVQISVKVIEFSSSDALNFGVGLVGGAPTLNNLSSRQLVRNFTSQFPMRQPLVGGNPVTDVGLFALGGIHDSWELNVQLQALEANNIANITSSPTLVVRNGGLATISTFTDFPFPKAKIAGGVNVATDIEFRPVGVSMNILPTIAGTKTVVLQLSASVSAITGFANTDPVDTPIVSDRSTTTTVHVNSGESVIIGGLVAESDFESETKVPILGDIPILGYLFRSTSRQKTRTELQFLITPKIIRGTNEIRAGSGGG